MSEKNLNFKIEENKLDKVNHYKGTDSQAVYVTKAIDEKTSTDRFVRSGGLVLKVPNPDFFVISENDKDEIMKALIECQMKLSSINPRYNFGIDYLVGYAKDHLFVMNKTTKEQFVKNMEEDSEF